jgi:peptide/nickel transport system substrate-binding protein
MKAHFKLALIAVTATALAVGVVSRSEAAPRSGPAIPLLRIGESSLGGSTLDVTKALAPAVGISLETLTTFTPDGKLKPNLAKSVTQPGKAVYVYHLRRGVKFWDGTEMTSADVANSLNYERYPGSQVSAQFQSVKSVVATDRYTVVVTLKHTDASWKYIPAGYGALIFEKAFQDAHKTTMGQPGVLLQGTGPWKIDSYNPTSSAELSANPHWWGGKVNIGHISDKFFSDETSMALAYRAGAIDVSFPRDGRAFAATAGTKITASAPQDAEGYFTMNVHVAPWSDVHVRRAVAYAINRQDFVTAYGGFATPVSTFISPDDLMQIASKAQVDALL